MSAKYRKGVFILVYSLNKIPNYLLLKRKLHWVGWEFPKGGVDEKESVADAVLRELKEETGLHPVSTKKFDFSGEYNYNKELPDRVGFQGQTFESLYAVEVKSSDMKKVKISEVEHSDYLWVGFSDAVKKLTWPNQQQALRLVHEYLIGKPYTGFRKSMTLSGKLLLAGKNDKSNEELVKNFAGLEDLVLHTKKVGSPFVIIKSEDKPTNEDIEEAAVFCARYSQDWRDNKKDVLVHYFKGKDISKTASMKTGTFGVKNVKEILVRKGEIE